MVAEHVRFQSHIVSAARLTVPVIDVGCTRDQRQPEHHLHQPAGEHSALEEVKGEADG